MPMISGAVIVCQRLMPERRLSANAFRGGRRPEIDRPALADEITCIAVKRNLPGTPDGC